MMSSLESIFYKKFIYRFIYLFKRKTIWKNLNNINNNSLLDKEIIKQKQLEFLKNQVLYCYNNIDFYEHRLKKSGFDIYHDFSIEYFRQKVPILEKNELRNYLKHQIRPKRPKNLVKRQTSGSSGNPIVLYKDNEAVSFIDAAMHRNFSWYGIDVGDRRGHFWGGASGLTNKLKYTARDYLTNWRRFNCFELSESSILKYHKVLKKFRPKYMYGYAKCVYEFASFALDLGLSLDCPPSVVIVTGEKIYSEHKKVISQFFKAPVAEEYGCTECGIIAFECSHGGMHIMSDMLHVETISDKINSESSDNSGSIVISELHGSHFPLLRYRIGDRGGLSEKTCDCGINFPLIEEVMGRDDDYIHCMDGTKIDAYCIEYSIQNIPATLGVVNQIKGRQAANYDVIVNVSGDFLDRTAWESRFNFEIKKHLNNLKVEVSFDDAIEREASGKLKFFESEIKS